MEFEQFLSDNPDRADSVFRVTKGTGSWLSVPFVRIHPKPFNLKHRLNNNCWSSARLIG